VTYFSDVELACKCGRKECDAAPIDMAALLALNDLRLEFNAPMTITSARRCRFWNKKQGGADDSQHLHGKAFDVFCPDGVFMRRLATLALRRGFSVGVKRRMLHLDKRDGAPVMFGYVD